MFCLSGHQGTLWEGRREILSPQSPFASVIGAKEALDSTCKEFQHLDEPCMCVCVCVCVSVCVSVCVCVCVYERERLSSVWLICDPIDSSLPGSSIHAIFPTRILEQVAISSSRGSSRSRDGTLVCCISCLASGFFTTCAIWKDTKASITGR